MVKMRYLAIGDGICKGSGLPFFVPGFAHRHARMIEKTLGEKVILSTLARPHYRTKDILELFQNQNVIRSIQESQMIVLSVGQQDFLEAMESWKKTKDKNVFNQAYNLCKSNVDDIIFNIRDLKKERKENYMLMIIAPHNPYPEQYYAENWIKRFNNHLECRANLSNLHALNLNDLFKDHFQTWCTKDLQYPNRIGHEEMAKRLHEIIQYEMDEKWISSIS